MHCFETWFWIRKCQVIFYPEIIFHSVLLSPSPLLFFVDYTHKSECVRAADPAWSPFQSALVLYWCLMIFQSSETQVAAFCRKLGNRVRACFMPSYKAKGKHFSPGNFSFWIRLYRTFGFFQGFIAIAAIVIKVSWYCWFLWWHRAKITVAFGWVGKKTAWKCFWQEKRVLVKTEQLIVVSLYHTRIEANFLTPEFSVWFMA